MRAVLQLAAKGQWNLTPALRQLVSAIYTGLLQTKMNEDANQQVRDHETRGNPSKVQRHFTQWSIPVESGLLKRNERAEVESQVGLPLPPRTADFEQLFHEVVAGTQDDPDLPDTVPLKRVIGEWDVVDSISAIAKKGLRRVAAYGIDA